MSTRYLRPTPVIDPETALEKHYSAIEVAELWQLDPSTVRRIFQDQPGVLKIGKSGRRDKRDHITLRIPESVLKRVYVERSR